MGKELQVLSDNNSLNIHIFHNISSHYVMYFLINQLLIKKTNHGPFIFHTIICIYIYGLLQFLMHEYCKIYVFIEILYIYILFYVMFSHLGFFF
jgi:hypothetical protein